MTRRLEPSTVSFRTILTLQRHPASSICTAITLIYRLEQIEKRTGLDIRLFEDAMTFKIAIMVLNTYRQKGTEIMNDALYEQLISRRPKAYDLPVRILVIS